MKVSEKKQKQAEALDFLRAHVKPGDYVYPIVKTVSSSGMSRTITVLVTNEQREIIDITYYVATVLEYRFNRDKWVLSVSGCGMDMCWNLVYELSSVLYGNKPATHSDGLILKYGRI